MIKTKEHGKLASITTRLGVVVLELFLEISLSVFIRLLVHLIRVSYQQKGRAQVCGRGAEPGVS